MENLEMGLGKVFQEAVETIPILLLILLGVIFLFLGIAMFINAFLFDLPVDKLSCNQRKIAGKFAQIVQGTLGLAVACIGLILAYQGIISYCGIAP